MRKQDQDQVIGICCSDIHLSSKPPRARRKEKDWFEAMARPLEELRALATRYDAPIICAGDVFDHWRAEPELINFALNCLPEMFAIPGQHDLPLHNIDLIKKSAFWTMCLTDKITPVLPGLPLEIAPNLVIHGFPWGTPLQAKEELVSKKLHVAVVHEYFWTDKHRYPGAADRQSIGNWSADFFDTWDAVIIGDNHKGFLVDVNGVNVLNCGGFMRRKSDEVDYEPQIGLLCASRKILLHKIKTSHEKFTTLAEEEEGLRKALRVHDLEDFLAGLSDLQLKQFDFIDAIEFALNRKQVNNDVRCLILQALGRE